MGRQPTPWEGSQAKGRGFLGCMREKTARAVVPRAEGLVCQGGWERSWPDLEGCSVGWDRTERLGPFSCALKEAGKGRKNKPRHTLGGCWLARALVQ
jgi:hypothetical protein